MSIWLIFIAVIIDLLIGDPVYTLHPVRLIGRLAIILETPTRKIFKNPEVAGLFTTIITLIIPMFLVYTICNTLSKLFYPAGYLACVFFIYSTIACKDMIKHSKIIHEYLKNNNLIMARAATASIVGRDTKHMTSEEVIRATVESIAENSVDGILAPLFYAFLGNLFWGIEGAAILATLYRTVNTLDSTYGYKNEKYLNFGRIPAKVDDLFNFIPARISLVFISIGALLSNLLFFKAFSIGIRDHGNHASPNSGYSEAAFAGALGLKFGGDTLYQGEITNRPELGDYTKNFSLSDISLACKLLINTTLTTTICYTVILLFIK